MRANPIFHEPIMDAAYHLEWARAVAAGEAFQPGEPFFRAPLYPWFLGVCLKMFGAAGLLAPRIVQCLFGAVTAALAFLVGERAFDRRVGLVAGLFAATYWVLIYFDGELLIPTLIVPLDLLGIWLALGLAEERRPRTLVASGLVFGLSAIARPNVLLFMPPLALWIVWLERARLARALRCAALFAAGLFAPILPITGYNYFAANDLVLVSTQAGVNLWIGNNPRSDGTTAIVPGTQGGWWQGFNDSRAMAEAGVRAERARRGEEQGAPVRASDVSRWFSRKAWHFIVSEPGRSLPLFWHKLKLFWLDRELGNNQDIRFFGHHFSPVVRWSPLSFSVLAPLGLFGLALSLRRARRLFPLWAFVPVYMASVVLFFVCSRFRVPVLAPLGVGAAATLVWLWDLARQRRWKPFVPAVALLCVASVLWKRSTPDPDDSNGYLQLGTAEATRGNAELAEQYLRRSFEINPRNTFARINLGKHLRSLGRDDEALRVLEEAVRIDPRVDGFEVLLDLLLEMQLASDAVRYATVGVRIHPDSEIPRYHLGRAQALGGELELAARTFEDAAARDSRSWRAAYALGEMRLQLREPAAALAALERAVELLPYAPDGTWRKRTLDLRERARRQLGQ